MKKTKQNMALNPFTVRSQTISNNNRDTFATVYNSGEISSLGEAAPIMCAKKCKQNRSEGRNVG